MHALTLVIHYSRTRLVPRVPRGKTTHRMPHAKLSSIPVLRTAPRPPSPLMTLQTILTAVTAVRVSRRVARARAEHGARRGALGRVAVRERRTRRADAPVMRAGGRREARGDGGCTWSLGRLRGGGARHEPRRVLHECVRVTTTRTYRLHITDGDQRRGAGPRRRVMGLHYVARVKRPHRAA